jgi:hypothetical protein
MQALTFRQALAKYRPDQARDERGRFTDEGGGGKVWRVRQSSRGARVSSSTALAHDALHAIARRIGGRVVGAVKTAPVRAVRARAGQVVETNWNGKETRNTAKEGDWVVTALTQRGKVLRDKQGNENTWIVSDSTFTSRYSSGGRSAEARDHGRAAGLG